jgi:hypothetical protein
VLHASVEVTLSFPPFSTADEQLVTHSQAATAVIISPMCGRYITAQAAALKSDQAGEDQLAVRTELQRRTDSASASCEYESGESVGLMMRWGLIPLFAKGEPPKYSTINARIETAETAASYRGPWKRGQRCIQLASGFYEWHLNEAGRKAPYLIKLNDQDVSDSPACGIARSKQTAPQWKASLTSPCPATTSCGRSTTRGIIRIECPRSCGRKITRRGYMEPCRRPRRCCNL